MMRSATSMLWLLSLLGLLILPVRPALPETSDPLYPRFDVGSTAPKPVTRDIESLIAEFAALPDFTVTNF